MSAMLKRSQVLISTRGMKAAYARWLLATITTGKPPTRKLGENVRIGGWLNFSEYWSFREAVPEPERRFMKHCLSRKAGQAIAFDVGANLGVFTCLLAEIGAREVHAFEPIPETMCRLKRNVAENGFSDRCRLNCLAVGNRSGLVSFRVQENSPATNRMLANHAETKSNSSESVVSVATVGLDAYCRTQNIDHIDFLKIDVEGMEPLVLQGARELLLASKVGAALIEICPANLRAAGFDPASLFDEITLSGYRCHTLAENGEPSGRVGLAEIEAMTLHNVLLLPYQDSAAANRNGSMIRHST